jgi:hypothetical protein
MTARPLPGREGRGKKGLGAALAREGAAELGKLTAEVARVLGRGAALGKAEQLLRDGLLKLGGEILCGLLSADRGPRGPRVSCSSGHDAELEPVRPKVIGTVLGPVTLKRAWYHCARCRHGLAPRDAELGVTGMSMSPGLAAMNDLAAAAGPFAGAARLIEEPAGIRLTVKRVERAAEASGTAAALAVRGRVRLISTRKLVPPAPSPPPDKLYAVIDGTGVPVTSKETAGREGKGDDGKAHTREVKPAVFFTQDHLDAKGRPVRDQASSSVITSFEPAAAFGKLVKAGGIRRGADVIRQFTVIGGGAPWIWGIASEKFPEATQIVDLYHAREHLHSLTRSVECMLGDRKDEWLAARLEDLGYGDIDGIGRAVREFPFTGVKKTEVDRELGYFLNNAPRMRYRWFRSRGLFVGSGVVEASCKSLIGARLKQSGMHWRLRGADAIITLRAQEASRHWNDICTPDGTQTHAA